MKKLIALFLCLVMVLGLVACGAKEEPKVEEPAFEVAETKEPEAAPEEVVSEQPEKVAPELGTLPLVTEEATITIGVRQSPNTEDYETNDYTKWIEEQTGVNLDFVYFSNDKDEAKTQLNLMIAGGEKLPDILWGHTGIDTALMYELGEDGYFVDLKDYFTEYGYWFWEEYEYIPEADQAAVFQYGTDPSNGAYYAFPRYTTGGGDRANSMPVINTAWLEAIGEEMPTNVDDLYTVLKKFATEDPNGNGVADEMALLGYEDGYRTDIIQWIINAYVYCLDDEFFNATDGQIWVPYTTDEYRQAMIFLNKLYAEGILSPLFYTLAEASEYAALMMPADGTAIAGVASVQTTLHFPSESEVMYQYAAMPALEAATELGGYAAIRGSTFEYNTFITADCADPVLAFKLLDFMCGQESYLRSRFGVKDVHWKWAEEGMVTSMGIPAAIEVIDNTVYANQNNVCWHDTRANVTSVERVGNAANLDLESWTGRRSALYASIFNTQDACAKPEEVVHKIVYNTEEQAYVSSVETQIEDYVAEARAMFVSGVTNPNDDAAWETYLTNLESLGLSQYVATAQSAYTRMTAE
ncbi:MAG: hypothetical protein J6J51_03065 [Clostridia bacterium]|nr:hypothetical protein [Clostridia bacterium]